MRRVTVGELDVLLVNTEHGIFAIDDRCPHMAAPLSIGELDGCIVACPLHEGRFDLAQRRPDADADDRRPRRRTAATTRPGRRPASDPKVDPPGKKAEARRLTRVRRFRYYPVRIVGRRDRGRGPRLTPAGRGRSASAG